MEQTNELNILTTFYNKYTFPSGITVSTSSFEPYSSEVREHHLIFSSKTHRGTVEEKIKDILAAYKTFEDEALLGKDLVPVVCRWFLSDIANQSRHIPSEAFSCATSIIGQPPVDGSKVALWVYCQNGVKTIQEGDNCFKVEHGEYIHLWQGDNSAECANSEDATIGFLNRYSERLQKNDCTLIDNCIRTWFFVRDVDINYRGVVVGRNKVFAKEGLNPLTHFIASTGIEGDSVSPDQNVAFNAYSVKGLKEGQVTYLKAYSHLNPTIEYGVAFERGTTVDYGDRKQVFISGTASIDNRGEILYPEDIEKQTMRMWQNVEALLNEADCGWENVGHIIVYLRDFSDGKIVSEMFETRFPEIPTVIVKAPVCRPGWLIEMECMAVKEQECLKFASY